MRCIKKLKVIDSIMGSGKSSLAIDMFKKNEEDKYLYITPYVKEALRIESESDLKRPLGSYEKELELFPELSEEDINYSSLNKTIQIEQLLKDGKSISSTHQALKYLSSETIKKYCGEYTLVLDEVMSLIEVIAMTKEAEVFLFNSQYGNDPILIVDKITGKIEVSDYGKSYDENKEGKLTAVTKDIIELASRGRLISIEGKTYVTEIPLDMFKYFKEVYIMSYLFEGSNMCDYLQSEGFTWDKYQVVGDYETGFQLAEWSEKLAKERCIELGQLIREPSVNKLKKRDKLLEENDITLSYNGQLNLTSGKGTAESRKVLGNLIRGYFRSLKINQADAMYTLYTPLKEKVTVKGFTNSYTVYNLKATNDYSDKSAMVYAVNRNINPQLKKHMAWKYSESEKESRLFDINKSRLGDMLQWIYRSRIRKGEEINLLVLDSQMRKLLAKWKKGNIV